MIKEIDDLIEDSDVEEEDLSEHGNQVIIEANFVSTSPTFNAKLLGQ